MKSVPLLIAAAIFIAGCGSTTIGTNAPVSTGATASSSASSSSPPGNTDAAAASKAVCGLFTRDEAQAVMGDMVQLAPAPVSYAESAATSAQLATGAAACEYVTTQLMLPGLLVAVDPKLDIHWGNEKHIANLQPVTGVGDEAFYVPGLSGAGGGLLFARHGAKYVYINSLWPYDTPADIKQREITLAQSILSKI